MIKKIFIVGPHSLGYLDCLVHELNNRPEVSVHLIQIDKFQFRYKNNIQRIYNALRKAVSGRNLKKEFVDSTVLNYLESLGHQDIIFLIRPDLLADKSLERLKTKCDSLQTFYYDSTRRFGRKLDIVHFFDKIYTYDPLDAEQYGFEFLTNYIYDESDIRNFQYQFFNISSRDYRYKTIEEIAAYINAKGWTSKIMVLGSDKVQSKKLEIIHKQIPIDRVGKLIEKSKIMIEVQRDEQQGLSFRVFESLGYRKKLVTTNADVVNYDFYNPVNIHVIDKNNIHIPDEFVNTDYQPVPDSVLEKYRLSAWIDRVFMNDLNHCKR